MKKKPLNAPLVTESPADAPAVPELGTKAHEGTPEYGEYGHPDTEPAPTLPPDRRAEGGNVFDLRNEQTTL